MRVGDVWADDRLPHAARRPPGLVMVASFADAQKLHGGSLVYVEHGAGQAYNGDPAGRSNGSYAGGLGLDGVVLFIAPSETVADRWRATYRAPVAVVGCPKLDRWHDQLAPLDGPPLIGLTFHWECPLVPETRSAFRHYQPALAGIRDIARSLGGDIIGHAHPRAWRAIHRVYARNGIPASSSLGDLLARCSLLIADNTSALYEFASLGRPVLVMNAPWYRRDVEHGLRFWSHVPGLSVDDPDDLPRAMARALADPADAQALRAAAVTHVYAHADGHAARRAADAILEVHRVQPEGPARRA